MATRFNRHIPRLCRSCDAPMARQEDKCWSCGAVWDDRATPDAAAVAAPDAGAATAGPVAHVSGSTSKSASQLTRVDTERWADEGGSMPSESPAPVRVPTAAQH